MSKSVWRASVVRSSSADASAPAGPDAAGGDVFAPFIASELETEEARRVSFEGRGVTVVTSSGTLATLLTGFIAVVAGGEKYSLPTGSAWSLSAALGFFVLAAGCGLFVNAPVEISRPTDEWLTKLKNEAWPDAHGDALKTVSASKIATLRSVVETNRRKARLLTLGIAFELLAVLALAVTTTWIAFSI
jgi:hypothetical protein